MYTKFSIAFNITPNVDVKALSSTILKIHFNYPQYSSPLLCWGNLSRDNDSTNLTQVNI